MLTSVKLSNISYNTDIFLTDKLNELLKGGQICYWCFINHKPDFQYLRDHKHLIIFPDTRLDTLNLDSHFVEPVSDNDLPLKCKLWTKTFSVYDWYLYALHDDTYLKIKYAEDMKIHYNEDDFISSDKDITHDLIFQSYHLNEFWKGTKWQKFINDGLSGADIVKRGYVSPSEMVAFHHFIQVIGLTY